MSVTPKQLALMERCADLGWEDVDGKDRTAARRRPDLFVVELDEEGSDPEAKDFRYVARLTAEGAAFLARHYSWKKLVEEADGSFIWANE
jgi:hypothetical protein